VTVQWAPDDVVFVHDSDGGPVAEAAREPAAA
jgi:hypothetical protein